MKGLTKISILLFALSLSTCKSKIPKITQIPEGAFLPTAPEGFHWELNPKFSDEFNGKTLDKSKWHDRSPYWVNGRPPATFRASTVSVKDGTLQIKNQPLVPATDKYNIAGGAVASVSKNAFYGYYEAKMKASGISMSSTFWMKNKPVNNDCPREQDELDIVEAVGMQKRGGDFNTTRRANTHIFRWDCKGEKEVLSKGGKAPMSPPASEAFHTFGCWWVDANTIKFYLDGEHQFTVTPKEPFERPMFMHLVTETYNWEDPPTVEELLNDEINTTYYDWVRSYKLVSD
ncbi:MAG: family 16 glycosylhydrolase [Bacteroidota bacterium]